MNIEGKPLPLIDNGAVVLDVWKLNRGLGITLSTPDGKVAAGAFFGAHDALKIANYIKAHIEPLPIGGG